MPTARQRHAPTREPGPLPELLERIYGIDLVYKSGCWKLCGDAHCCNFARHKARFHLIAADSGQTLTLLPGEFDYLDARGWTAQFEDYERDTVVYDYGPGAVLLDTVVSRRPGCACEHDTRTAMCRLYPLLPVFAADGRLLATEPLGIYDELEQLDGLAPACQISALPFPQMNLFLELSGILASHPVLLFHLMAYRLAKRHIADRIGAEQAAAKRSGASAFALFERAFIQRRLFDHEALKTGLVQLRESFVAIHGERFDELMAEAVAGAEAGLASPATA